MDPTIKRDAQFFYMFVQMTSQEVARHPLKIFELMVYFSKYILWNHLCEEFTGYWWIPLIKTSNEELWCFFDLRLDNCLSK